MVSSLVETLRKMYKDSEYKLVDDSRIKKYLEMKLITEDEVAYIKGDIANE